MPKYIFETKEPIIRCRECPLSKKQIIGCALTGKYTQPPWKEYNKRPASCPLVEVKEG
jgi:hypothetical protein